MVKVKFFHLLRSKYNIKEIEVFPGTIHEILGQIKDIYPSLDLDDFKYSVVFVNSTKIFHPSKFDEYINDGDEIVFTHFVGGG